MSHPDPGLVTGMRRPAWTESLSCTWWALQSRLIRNCWKKKRNLLLHHDNHTYCRNWGIKYWPHTQPAFPARRYSLCFRQTTYGSTACLPELPRCMLPRHSPQVYGALLINIQWSLKVSSLPPISHSQSRHFCLFLISWPRAPTDPPPLRRI